MKPSAWLKIAAVSAAVVAMPMAGAAQKKAGSAPAAKSQAARDWSTVVASTPEGGFRMGDPAAPMKIVEYGSFTCPHCAHFTEEGFPVIVRDYVRTGKASFEDRPFVRDPIDMAAALIARCASPAAFFPVTHRIFGARDQWIGKFQALSSEQLQQINALPVPQRMVRFANAGGLTLIGSQAGIPAAKAQQCLADKKGLDQLVAMREAAVNRYAIQGTPSFLVNGKKQEAHDWSSLQPLLKPPAG